MSGSHLSRELFNLVKSIGESKSKQEEDRMIVSEMCSLKSSMSVPAPAAGRGGRRKALEFLVRVMYCEMLGHDCSFAYIKCVELAASSSLLHKRAAYLCCGACLSPNHEFRFMLVNRLQKDLASDSFLDACVALTALNRLCTPSMVPAVCALVEKLLSHPSEFVRKKAVVTMVFLHGLDGGETVAFGSVLQHLRRVLCDRDPAVMGAALCAIERMLPNHARSFKVSFSNVLHIIYVYVSLCKIVYPVLY